MSTYHPVTASTSDDEIREEAADMAFAVLGETELTERERKIVAVAVETAIHQATARALRRVEAAIFG